MARKVSEFVRVALEGATIDNRKITRKQIEEMAANYDPDNKYGARIWLEHFRSLFPDGAFPALGDVLKVKAMEEDGKMGLYAKLSPTDQLLQMNQKRQKVYTSIEMDPSYADTGQAYLVGLAVTDSPASQGTQMLAFSQQNNKFAENKLFSEFLEAELQFQEEQPETPNFFTRVKELLSKKSASDDTRFSEIEDAVEEIAKEVVDQGKQQSSFASKNELKDLADKLEEQISEFNTLRNVLDNEEKNDKYNRSLATGADGERVKAKF